MRIALVSCALVGCAYKPGSFVAPQADFSGQRASAGCLDVAIERRPDLPIGPVLRYQFANRCDHATTVDLRAVAVVGRNADGEDVGLRPYDPRAEIHPMILDGRKVGAEALAYRSSRSVSQVCVDVATLARPLSPASSSSSSSLSQWLCFGAAGLAVAGGVP